jgi:hypothetical protein
MITDICEWCGRPGRDGHHPMCHKFVEKPDLNNAAIEGDEFIGKDPTPLTNPPPGKWEDLGGDHFELPVRGEQAFETSRWEDDITDDTLAATMRRGLGLPPKTVEPLPADEKGPILSTDSADRKRTPIFRGCIAYFPEALAAIAQLSLDSNEKHNPGEPLHWSHDKSNDHLDCIARHLIEEGSYDPDDRYLHDVKLAWRALANLTMVLRSGKKAKI